MSGLSRSTPPMYIRHTDPTRIFPPSNAEALAVGTPWAWGPTRTPASLSDMGLRLP